MTVAPVGQLSGALVPTLLRLPFLRQPKYVTGGAWPAAMTTILAAAPNASSAANTTRRGPLRWTRKARMAHFPSLPLGEYGVVLVDHVTRRDASAGLACWRSMGNDGRHRPPSTAFAHAGCYRR